MKNFNLQIILVYFVVFLLYVFQRINFNLQVNILQLQLTL